MEQVCITPGPQDQVQHIGPIEGFGHEQIRVCVVGYGNVDGKQLRSAAPDMELAAVVEVLDVDCPMHLWSGTWIPENVDVAVLAVPSRVVPKVAPEYLAKGINTVDGYDIHGDSTLSLRRQLDECAEQSGATAIIGAGWDPGTDSIIRMLFSAIAPHGITYTNFGPGMSMGHSCAVRDIPGVKDGVSFTLPVGYGQHNRDVYVELDDPARFDEIARQSRKTRISYMTTPG